MPVNPISSQEIISGFEFHIPNFFDFTLFWGAVIRRQPMTKARHIFLIKKKRIQSSSFRVVEVATAFHVPAETDSTAVHPDQEKVHHCYSREFRFIVLRFLDRLVLEHEISDRSGRQSQHTFDYPSSNN